MVGGTNITKSVIAVAHGLKFAAGAIEIGAPGGRADAASGSDLRETGGLWETGAVGVIFLSGPIGAGKTVVARALLPLLPAPLSYIEADTFWSFIRKGGDRGMRENFPVLVRSMTAAAVPFARSGFRVLIDFSIPPAYVETARKILKEVPFDFVLLRQSGRCKVLPDRSRIVARR